MIVLNPDPGAKFLLLKPFNFASEFQIGGFRNILVIFKIKNPDYKQMQVMKKGDEKS